MASASCNLLPILSPSHSPSIIDASSKTVVKCAASATFPMRGVFSASLERASCHPESDRAIGKINSLVTEGRLAGAARGAGVLERPGLDQSNPETAPRTEEGGEMGKSSQKVSLGSGDRYRVLLLDDERHTESQVAKVIPRVVPVVTPDEARKCFFESKEFGVGLVTVAVKEHAEFYVQMLVRYGLRSSMEQDSSVA